MAAPTCPSWRLGTAGLQVRVLDQRLQFVAVHRNDGSVAVSRNCLKTIDDGEHAACVLSRLRSMRMIATLAPAAKPASEGEAEQPGADHSIPKPFGGNLIHDSRSVEPSGAEAPAMSVRREPTPPPESTNQPTTRMRIALFGPSSDVGKSGGLLPATEATSPGQN